MKLKYRIEGPSESEGFLEGLNLIPATGDLLFLNGAPFTAIAREIHYTNGSVDDTSGGVVVIVREGTGQLRQ
jgi:hypothetical protein